MNMAAREVAGSDARCATDSADRGGVGSGETHTSPQQQTERAVEMIRAGYNAVEIGRALNRTSKGVRELAKRRGLELAKAPKGGAAQSANGTTAQNRVLEKSRGERGPKGDNPERDMWQAVLVQAFVDATYPREDLKLQHEKRKADSWIRSAGTDFRFVCNLAGMDADFLRDAYVAGRVSRERLRSADTVKQ